MDFRPLEAAFASTMEVSVIRVIPVIGGALQRMARQLHFAVTLVAILMACPGPTAISYAVPQSGW